MADVIVAADRVITAVNAAMAALSSGPDSPCSNREQERIVLKDIQATASWVLDHKLTLQQVVLSKPERELIEPFLTT